MYPQVLVDSFFRQTLCCLCSLHQRIGDRTAKEVKITSRCVEEVGRGGGGLQRGQRSPCGSTGTGGMKGVGFMDVMMASCGASS